MANTFPPIPPSQRGDRSLVRWWNEVRILLGDASQILWTQINFSGSLLTDIATRLHSNLQTIEGADNTDTNTTRNKHVSNNDMKTLKDNDAKTADDTDTNTTRDKHVSNNDMKVNTDHIANVSNPHAVDADDLNLGTTDTPTFAGVNLGDENLNTYNEGSWTPVLAGGSTAGTQTYAHQVGRFTQTGNTVTAHFSFLLTAFDGATSGIMTITGLPSTASTVANLVFSGAVGPYSAINLDAAGGYSQLVIMVQNNASIINIQECGDNVSVANLTEADFGNTSGLRGTLTYQTG